MRNNIENPYKVNENHHWDKAISADFVQVFRRGKLLWIVYLFSAGAVTPMRTVEFSRLNDCEEWAKNKGCDVWTYFGLDLEDVNADMRIISRSHGTGKVIAYSWTEKLVSNIASAYSLADIEEVIAMLMNSDSVNCPNATFTLVHVTKVRDCVRCQNVFVMSDTMPDRLYCSEMCWQLDKSNNIRRDDEGNIIAGRINTVKQSEDNMQTNDGRQRRLLKRLQTELRNTGKADYREYVITISTNGYRIGHVIGDEKIGHIVYHVHCNTVAECIEWVDSQKRKGQTIDFQSCLKKDSLNAINDDVKTLSEIEYTHAHAAFCTEIIFVDDNGNQYEYDGVCISEDKLKVSIRKR